MPSFDIVSEVNQVEVKNAVDQCNKEITNRFDFKGSDARVEIQDQDPIFPVYPSQSSRKRTCANPARTWRRPVTVRAQRCSSGR